MKASDEQDNNAPSLMRIVPDAEGTFVSRPNRFLGIVDINGVGEQEVHVHDPGRLRELLYPGNRVLVRRAQGGKRRTAWDLIAAKNDGDVILVNSAFHRGMVEKILELGLIPQLCQLKDVRAEVKVGDSRLDFMLTTNEGDEIAVEVKGCTLAIGGRALFPDAPTTRGARHVRELTEFVRKGGRAAIIVLVFRPEATSFSPNASTDPVFTEALRKAVDAGVECYPLGLELTDHVVRFKRSIPLVLDQE